MRGRSDHIHAAVGRVSDVLSLSIDRRRRMAVEAGGRGILAEAFY